MLKIILSGANGRLGRTLASCIAEMDDIAIVAGVDLLPAAGASFPVYTSFEQITEPADAVVDFSRPDALHSVLEFAQSKNISAVLATTGYSANDKMMIVKYSGHIPVFFSANMSLGVNLQIELAKKAAEVLADRFDIEIIEKHHNLKVDSPSGTALAIAEGINSVFNGNKNFVYGRHDKNARRTPADLGIHAVRGGTVVGEHDILFMGPDEVLEINHKAYSKQIFAQGAIHAAKYIAQKAPGLYSMADLLHEAGAL